MKKLVCLVLVLVFCMSFACTAFATEADDSFVSSPSEPTTGGCNHGKTFVVGQKGATCSANGYSGDVVCDECGEVVEEGVVTAVDKTVHNYVDGVCVDCQHVENNPVTGDGNVMLLWIGVMAIAVIGLVAVLVAYRKKFANQ